MRILFSIIILLIPTTARAELCDTDLHLIDIYGYLYGTGFDPDLNYVAERAIQIFNESLCVEAEGSITGENSVVSYAFGGGLEEYESRLSYEVSKDNFNIKAFAIVEGGDLRNFKPSARAEVRVSWRDTVTLVGPETLPFDNLYIKANGHAAATSSGHAYGNMNLTMGGDYQGWDLTAGASTLVFLSAEDNFTLTQDPGSVYFSATYNWGGGVNVQNKLGYGFFDAGNTFELEHIVFPDGSTPEDHGFDIVFASGMKSPNIAVPEPSMFALLLSLFCMGSLLRTRRSLCRGKREIHG